VAVESGKQYHGRIESWRPFVDVHLTVQRRRKINHWLSVRIPLIAVNYLRILGVYLLIFERRQQRPLAV
jgi:hypothetical protein